MKNLWSEPAIFTKIDESFAPLEENISETWLASAMQMPDPFESSPHEIENTYYYEMTDGALQNIISKSIDTRLLLDLHMGYFTPIVMQSEQSIYRNIVYTTILEFMTFSDLERIGFVVKKHKLIKISRSDKHGSLMMTITMCIHRAGKAYGKILTVQCILDDSNVTTFLYAKVDGTVTQEVVEMSTYQSNQLSSSLSPSLSIFST